MTTWASLISPGRSLLPSGDRWNHDNLSVVNISRTVSAALWWQVEPWQWLRKRCSSSVVCGAGIMTSEPNSNHLSRCSQLGLWLFWGVLCRESSFGEFTLHQTLSESTEFTKIVWKGTIYWKVLQYTVSSVQSATLSPRQCQWLVGRQPEYEPY
jgi:hypothetical protein